MKRAFKNSSARNSYPALTIVTAYDGLNTPSFFTKAMDLADLRRLVNLARQTLHHLMNSNGILDFPSFKSILNCDHSIYDIVIQLKPLQVNLL